MKHLTEWLKAFLAFIGIISAILLLAYLLGFGIQSGIEGAKWLYNL